MGVTPSFSDCADGGFSDFGLSETQGHLNAQKQIAALADLEAAAGSSILSNGKKLAFKGPLMSLANKPAD